MIADELSRQKQVLPKEWTLDCWVYSDLWKLWGEPMLDLFAMSRNHCLPLFCSPFPDLLAWETDAKLQNWANLDLYAFPLFAIISQVLRKFQLHQNARMTLVAPFWPQKEWFLELIGLLVDFPRLQLALQVCSDNLTSGGSIRAYPLWS